MKKLFYFQFFVLLAGTIFAWYTVVGDFARFYRIEGTIFKLQDCVTPNPVTTACFWGAWAFLGALVWSYFILKWPEEKQLFHQKRLVLLLVGGTIFAWSNFGLGWMKFIANQGRPTVGCSGQIVANPFFTPCFWGSVFFTAALVVSLVVLKKQRAK